MTNKDYNELLKENQRLKLELEAAYTKLERLYEHQDYITGLVATVYGEVDNLKHQDNKLSGEMTEFSRGIDLEVESKIAKLK